jgi:hypothetical protein
MQGPMPACGPPTMTRVRRANAAPPQGRAWQPGQRWNDIRWDGEAVAKRITRDEARRRRDVEVAMLTRLAGVVPLPRAFASEDPLAVRMEYVPGPLAEQWIAGGYNAFGLDELVRRSVVFLRGCGEMLRALHAVDPGSFADVLTGAGPSVIHADPGPVLRRCAPTPIRRLWRPAQWSRRHAAVIERCRAYYAASGDEVKRSSCGARRRSTTSADRPGPESESPQADTGRHWSRCPLSQAPPVRQHELVSK